MAKADVFKLSDLRLLYVIVQQKKAPSLASWCFLNWLYFQNYLVNTTEPDARIFFPDIFN